MKLFISLILSFTLIQISAQSKNKLLYESEVIEEILFKKTLDFKEDVSYDRPLGVNVGVIVDTVFSTYDVYLTDKDGKKIHMIFEYVDSLPSAIRSLYSTGKIFFAKFMNQTFLIEDYSETSKNKIVIGFVKEIPDGRYRRFIIKSPKRVQYLHVWD